MDKNTIIGLVLIGILLVGFSILSRPSQEQLEAQQHYYDSIAQVQQREAELKAKAEAALANEKAALRNDSTALFFQALQGKEELITIENNVASLTLNTKGGSIYQSILKEYKEQDKETPLTLFRGGDASLNFLFYNLEETIQSKDYYFTPVNRTDSTVTMRLQADSTSYIDFEYAMHPDNYLVDFNIRAVGMEGKLAATNKHVDIEWRERARQIEKGYTYENRLADLTYKIEGEGTDYLSANADDEQQVAEEHARDDRPDYLWMLGEERRSGRYAVHDECAHEHRHSRRGRDAEREHRYQRAAAEGVVRRLRSRDAFDDAGAELLRML